MLTAQKPSVLSKGFSLAKDGTLQKHPGGQLAQGTCETQDLVVSDFCALLEALQPNQALTFGVCGHDRATVAAQGALGKVRGKLPVIARDRAHFTWPTGPGMLMLDFDPAPDTEPLTRETLLGTLYEVWPELREAPHVWRESASSCIYRADTDEQVRGVMGQRVYVPVLDAHDIPRTGAALYARLWLAGHGRFDLSGSGVLLDRSIIDASVWQPERLDFAGGAQCGPGLEQRRGAPKLFNGANDFLDSRTMADLDPNEQEQVDKLRRAAREARQPDSAAKRTQWVETRLKAVPSAKKKDMRDVLERAVTQNRLLGDFVLFSENFGQVTVAEILDNPDKFHNTRFADPLEPEYGNDRRIARANLKAAGKPYLWSHAHGGQRFTLRRAVQTVTLEGGELQNISRKLLELMRLDGVVFAREDELVRLTDGAAHPVSHEWLQWHLTGIARFVQFDSRSKKEKIVDCPLSLARSICALSGQWGLPALEAVLTAPSMTASGRVIQEEGFDRETGLYLHFTANDRWRTIPEHPDEQTAKAALERLWKPFEAFPFVSPVDRGGFLAALLTAIVRPLLPTAPGFLISAPVAGSGKTLLALCVAALCGATPGVSSAGRDEDELGKTLLTELRRFSRCVVFDNLARPLESESLCAYLSTPHYSGRLLGTNSNISGRPVAVVLLTGNNPTVIGDLNRRLIRISVDPGCEKPHDRRFDLEPLTYVQEHRLELVRAGLLMLKAAQQSGFRHGGGRLASFEIWSDFIRNAVVWIGKKQWLDVGDPAASIDLSFAVDPETNRLKTLQNEWKRVFEKRGGTVAEAIRRATDKNAPDEDLFDVLNEIAGERGTIPPRRLGNWLSRHEGRIVDGSRFARCGTNQRRVVWFVQSVSYGEFGEFSQPNAWKTKGDNFTEGGETTHQTQLTHTCGACFRYVPNAMDAQTKPGVCETPFDGIFTKLPEDGTECQHFEQVTH
ncbi:hypothetical protein [Syntrophobacter fumaroxidans]|uniref:hypothetical protein n=1 Tax=Syntrophobacter fumaroxidans TaxID=119484 RepID=UPI00123755E4|nr:hypothetical protein [Syntrophobacter fumaroxidans]